MYLRRAVDLVRIALTTRVIGSDVETVQRTVTKDDQTLARKDAPHEAAAKTQTVGNDLTTVGICRIDTEGKRRAIRQSNRTERPIQWQRLVAAVVELDHVDVATATVLRRRRLILREDLVDAQLLVVFEGNFLRDKRGHQHEREDTKRATDASRPRNRQATERCETTDHGASYLLLWARPLGHANPPSIIEAERDGVMSGIQVRDR